jgi:hypothetical protein
MVRDAELARLKSEIQAVDKRGTATRYPDALRDRVVKFIEARRQAGLGIAAACRQLGLPVQSVQYWRKTRSGSAIVPVGFAPVTIVESPGPNRFTLQGPRGIRVDGLTLQDVVELMRRLG